MQRYLIIIWLFLTQFQLSAQVSWQRVYGEEMFNEGVSVVQTANHDYVFLMNLSRLSGNSSISLMCTDTLGEIKWIKRITDTLLYTATDLQIAADGGFLISGSCYTDTSTTYDVCLIKTGADGEREWIRTYGGGGWDFGTALLANPDSGCVIVGETYSYGRENGNIYIIRTDAQGDTLWTRVFGGDSLDFSSAVVAAADGSYLIAANTYSFGAGDMDAWIMKIAQNGDGIWSAFYGDTLEDRVYAICSLWDAGFVFSGSTRSYGAQERDTWLIRFDAMGNSMWELPQAWTIGSGDQFTTSLVVNDSNFFVYSGWFAGPTVGGYDYFITVMGDFYNWRSGTSFGDLEDELLVETIFCHDGGYLLMGQTDGLGPANTNMYVVKTGPQCQSPGNIVYTTGFKEDAASQAATLNVFPNPARETVYLQHSGFMASQDFYVRITDLQGRQMSEAVLRPMQAGLIKLGLDGLNPGLYLLEIRGASVRMGARLMVQ
jgi:hypothetical protein